MNDSAKREYWIVGGGAVGGTLAFYLARAGHVVRVVDADERHVAAIRRHGVTIDRRGERLSQRVSASTPSDPQAGKARRVLMCVKGVGATEAAADWIASRLAPDGFVVCAQNGLHVLEVAKRVGRERTVGAFVDFFADVIEPGVISDGGAGSLVVGELNGLVTDRIEEVVADLQAWGPAEATRNILGYLWSKLAFSSMLAATALVDAPMAELIDQHRDLMLAIAGEVFDLARRFEVSLESFDGFDPYALGPESNDKDGGIDRLVAWLRGQTKTRSGVWRDLAVHRRATEASLRYADVVQLRDSFGASSPHLEALVAMLREIESGRRDIAHENLDDLERTTSAMRDL